MLSRLANALRGRRPASAIVSAEPGAAGEPSGALPAVLDHDRNGPAFHCEVGYRRFQSGELAAAMACYQRALAVDPDYLPAIHGAAGVAHYQGDYARAVSGFQRALVLAGGNPALHFNLGNALFKLGRREEAGAHYSRVLEHEPEHVDAMFALATVVHLNGELERARGLYEALLDLQPERAEAQLGLAAVHEGAGDLEEATDCLELAIHYRPDYRDALLALGRLRFNAADYAEAVRVHEQALALDPQDVEVMAELGRALHKSGRMADAVAVYREVLTFESGLAEVYSNLGLALRDLGELESANTSIRRALALAPEFGDAWCNLGLVLSDLRRREEAQECFRRSARLEPERVDAGWNLVTESLLVGNFSDAWAGYEMRWLQDDAGSRPECAPEWEDEAPLDGKRLLVYGEQGLGDEIMFASCIPDLQAQGAKLAIACDPRLVPIFARSFRGAVVVGASCGQPDPDAVAGLGHVDLQVPIGSLPLRFRRDRSQFPAHRGYLQPDLERVEHWRRWLDGCGPGLKVGLSWRGGADRTRRLLRSLSLSQLEPLLAVPGVQFVSLQYGDVEAELEEFHCSHKCTIHHFPTAIASYDETAALVCALDLVISVQTAVIHLGGALGRPVWVIVPSTPEWRYGSEGSRMPWYPSVRLYRQDQPMAWGAAIEQVRQALAQRASDIDEEGRNVQDSQE